MPAERDRLAEVPTGRAPWRHWGPYLAERAWGSVREDYSADGDAWASFPFEQARSRAFRWNEDGLGGICDDQQELCLAFSFWNGRDPILKERIFGLGGTEGNHGEDAKEYWWYLDSTPTHSWMRWRYVYPQAEFPYQELRSVNARRGKQDPEYELVDTGIFNDRRYWDINAEYAKASAEDMCIRLTVRNCGPDSAELHVLPTLWFRNTWAWKNDAAAPQITLEDGQLVAEGEHVGRRVLSWSGTPEPLFCDNETNSERLWDVRGRSAFPKDGIGDHVVDGAPTVNPARRGSRAGLWNRLTVAPGATASLLIRFSDGPTSLGSDFGAVMSARRLEADEFYDALAPPGTSRDTGEVMRQALAGMLWCKQFYHYNVDEWLDGDEAGPHPPPIRAIGRNAEWRHLNNRDVVSMPDTWEYPWYAAWDLAFHCVTLAHVDAEFAKSQLILLCREWFMHPNGQLPAYEWNFGDVNPPVQAWAALRVFTISGSHDYEFLERVFQKLLLNFTWWVNRKDEQGNNVFEGGFLGLDNIGLFNRSAALPIPGHLEQSDGTAWMAFYCLGMLEISLILADHDDVYQDIATKFFEHFTMIALALNEHGMWNEADGFFYDAISPPDGPDYSLPVRSLVGLIPILAVAVLDGPVLAKLSNFGKRMDWYTRNRPKVHAVVEHIHHPGNQDRRLLSVVSPGRLRRVLARMLDETEFLSPYGIRSVSKFHLEHPVIFDLGGMTARVDYEPGESTTGLFGGNSNWRGPIWFPLNYLIIEALLRFDSYLGDDFRVECPTGSGTRLTLHEVASELSDRLTAIFLTRDNRRAVFGDVPLFQNDPAWRDNIPFHEYFHGDTGKGLGASHQTGWTGLVADLIIQRPGRHHDSATPRRDE